MYALFRYKFSLIRGGNFSEIFSICPLSVRDKLKVAYTFVNNCLCQVTEYGVEDGAFVTGASTTYSYSVASKRTIVQTTEQMDAEEGEISNNVIKTVYTFDDDGEVISEYMYSEDTGNTGVEG